MGRLRDAILRHDVKAVRKAISGGFFHKPEDVNVELLLILCSEYGTSEIASELIDAGARLDAVNTNGDSALHVAAKANNDIIMKELIHRGIDLEAVNREGLIPNCAVADSREGIPKGVKV
jgi:ankyrin repeat protein